MLPSASYPSPALRAAPPALDLAREVLEFPAQVLRAVRAQHAGFALRIAVRRHRRWLQVVGPRLVPAAEYLSGDIRSKLATARLAAGQDT